MTYKQEEDTSLNWYVGRGLWECRKCGCLNSVKDKKCWNCGNSKGYPLREGMRIWLGSLSTQNVLIVEKSKLPLRTVKETNQAIEERYPTTYSLWKGKENVKIAGRNISLSTRGVAGSTRGSAIPKRWNSNTRKVWPLRIRMGYQKRPRLCKLPLVPS